MDKTQAWRVTRRYAKTAAEWTATEADRRKALRAQRKPLVADARKALAEARKVDPDRTRGITHRAERELRAAQRRVPDPLWLFASKAAIAAGVAGYVGLPLVPHRVWWWSAVGVAAIVAGTAAWLAARMMRRPAGLAPTAEEAALLARLQPEHWREHCEGRGLAGTLTARPELTPSGIVVEVRLDGTWTAGKLRAAGEHVRALLGCRTDLRMEIKAGERGGWARLILRTRSAADGIELTGWKPGDPWGIDTVTGELVMVPLGRRMLIAGTSGAGKSWSTRALLAEASETADHRLIVVDPKRVEAINWQHRARTAITPDEVLGVSDELVAEMHERLGLVPRGRDVIEISPERPRITVFVDEGAEVIAMSRGEYARVMENFRTLARMARAAEIILIWATQKPTMDKNGGIDPQISAQIIYRAALALSTSGEARVVFGEDATEKGWHAHDLDMPGFAMLRSGPKAKPHPIKTRAFSPADVIALPDRPIWQQTAAETVDAAPSRPRLALVKDTGDSLYVPATRPALEGAEARVVDALTTAGTALRQKDIADRTGLSKGAVSKTVGRLVEAGHLTRTADGLYAVATKEATA